MRCTTRQKHQPMVHSTTTQRATTGKASMHNHSTRNHWQSVNAQPLNTQPLAKHPTECATAATTSINALYYRQKHQPMVHNHSTRNHWSTHNHSTHNHSTRNHWQSVNAQPLNAQALHNRSARNRWQNIHAQSTQFEQRCQQAKIKFKQQLHQAHALVWFSSRTITAQDLNQVVASCNQISSPAIAAADLIWVVFVFVQDRHS